MRGFQPIPGPHCRAFEVDSLIPQQWDEDAQVLLHVLHGPAAVDAEQPFVTLRWETPIPSVSRPHSASLTVSAWLASATGWRRYVGSTAGPSSRPGACGPAATSSVSTSGPLGMPGIQALS